MVLLSSSMQSYSSFSVWAGLVSLGSFVIWRGGVSGSCRMHLGCESAKMPSGAWVLYEMSGYRVLVQCVASRRVRDAIFKSAMSDERKPKTETTARSVPALI